MALEACDTKTNRQGRELKEHGTAAFPVAFYDDDLTSEAVPWHWHDELEVLVVAEGQAVVASGSDKTVLTEGTGFFINAGVLHAVENAGSAACRLHSVVFHPRFAAGSIDSILWQSYLHPLLENPALRALRLDPSAEWQSEAIRAIEAAWQCGVSELPGYEFQVRAALSQMIFLLSGYRSALQKPPSEKALRDGARIKRMLQYVQAHYAEELSTAQIAQSAAISESECLRCFRNTIGTPPIQYLKQLRIQRAAALLASTDLRIVEIGAQCGFQEMSYFAKAFRELRGLTPSAYRKAKRQQAAGD